MNIIALVGHQASGYSEVENLLKQQGMAGALPSRREGFSVSAINVALCKAHNTIPADPLDPSTLVNPIEPIQPAPLWDNLALDLLLANLDQPLWGWADPQTLYLLDYWLKIDANISFLFVYQEPQQVLEQALHNNSRSQARSILDYWTAYHETLLRFFLRHPERCFLAHSQQLLQHPQESLSCLPYLQVNAANTAALPAQTDLARNPKDPQLESTPLTAFIHQELTQEHAAQALYAELESVANLALQKKHSATSLEAAWETLQHQSQTLTETTETQKRLSQELASTQEKLEQLYSEKQQSETDLKEGREKSDQALPELLQAEEGLKQQLADTQEENELLLLQLHQVQEELEHLYLESVGQKQAHQKPNDNLPHYGAAERVKSSLAFRLGTVIINIHNNKGRLGYIKLPFALLRELIVFRKEKASRSNQNLPPISEYADAYMAQEVKQKLAYRLGKITMRYGKSPLGWIKLPSALRQEAKPYL